MPASQSQFLEMSSYQKYSLSKNIYPICWLRQWNQTHRTGLSQIYCCYGWTLWWKCLSFLPQTKMRPEISDEAKVSSEIFHLFLNFRWNYFRSPIFHFTLVRTLFHQILLKLGPDGRVLDHEVALLLQDVHEGQTWTKIFGKCWQKYLAPSRGPQVGRSAPGVGGRDMREQFTLFSAIICITVFLHPDLIHQHCQ